MANNLRYEVLTEKFDMSSIPTIRKQRRKGYTKYPWNSLEVGKTMIIRGLTCKQACKLTVAARHFSEIKGWQFLRRVQSNSVNNVANLYVQRVA